MPSRYIKHNSDAKRDEIYDSIQDRRFLEPGLGISEEHLLLELLDP